MSYYAGKGNKYQHIPEIVYDFHGYTTLECQNVIDDLIQEQEFKHVRFIVGKGMNSSGGPVLPNFVKNYLTENGIRYNISKLENGGEGALEVFF